MNEEHLVIGDDIYNWDEKSSAYLGSDTSCGVYGAHVDEHGKWFPAWIHSDCNEIDLANESFDDLYSAIKRSHSYFS